MFSVKNFQVFDPKMTILDSGTRPDGSKTQFSSGLVVLDLNLKGPRALGPRDPGPGSPGPGPGTRALGPKDQGPGTKGPNCQAFTRLSGS